MSSDALFPKSTGFCHKRKHLANTVPFVCYLREASGRRMKNYEEMPGAVPGLGMINLGTNLGTAFPKEDTSCCTWGIKEPTAPKGCKSKPV